MIGKNFFYFLSFTLLFIKVLLLFRHCQLFNNNYKILFDKFDAFSKKGTACDVTNIIGLMSYTNMMECVMSQEVKETSK